MTDSPIDTSGSHQRGRDLTKVITITLVSIAGVGLICVASLAALGIYGFRRRMFHVKRAEASYNLGRIAKNAASAFEREQMDTRGNYFNCLCPSASQSVPASPMFIRGKKYHSQPADWGADSSVNAGFACLKFSLIEPQYYMYHYQASGSGAVGDSFLATAQGDLDGDGRLSRLSLGGRVDSSSAVRVDIRFAEVDSEE